MNRELSALLNDALICSLFVSPLDPGLSMSEVLEIGRQFGCQDGEIRDTFPHVSKQHHGRDRFVPTEHDIYRVEFSESADDQLLDLAAIDFVHRQINERIKADGVRQARLSRDVIAERAVAAGINRSVVEGAIAALLLMRNLSEDEGRIGPPSQQVGELPLYSDRQRPRAYYPNKMRARALALVRDVVGRRTDGRSRHADPLNAFPDALDQLGFRHFRMWWMQTVAELRGSDPHAAPVSCTVLSAALVEGALTFVVKYARDRDLGPFRSPDFEREPRTWKIEDLIKSAATGGAAAILSPQLKARAEMLTKARQRIHAGRMLAEHPTGVPDLRPEEAREAKGIAEQVVRAVLDWLEKTSPV